jgi:hypothetical protein
MLLKKILLPWLAVASLSINCAALLAQPGSKVDFSCVIQDERLGAPFKDPAAARAWLKDTRDYLLEMARRIKDKEFAPTHEDIERFDDLADLVERAQSCLE